MGTIKEYIKNVLKGLGARLANPGNNGGIENAGTHTSDDYRHSPAHQGSSDGESRSGAVYHTAAGTDIPGSTVQGCAIDRLPENTDYVPEQPPKKVNTCMDMVEQAAEWLMKPEVKAVEVKQGYRENDYSPRFDPVTGIATLFVVDDNAQFFGCWNFEFQKKKYYFYMMSPAKGGYYWLISRKMIEGKKQF